MKTLNLRLTLLGLSAAAALAGCTSSKEASRGVEVSGPQVAGKPGAPGQTEVVPQISARAKLLFEDANKAYEAQRKAGKIDYASLERKYQQAAAADPNLAEADYNLGVLAERQGNRQRAVEHYKTALRKKPTLKEAAENLAVIAQNSGDEDGAIRVYQNILENYPDDASSRARMAEIYRRRGDSTQAVELAKQALFRDPKTLTAYKVLMQVHYEQKQFQLAKLVALRASKLDENDPEIYHTLGMIALHEKEPAKARVHLKTAVEKRPDFLPAHLVLARMALEQEDYEGAEESFRRILQADGKNAEAHLNLGIAYKGLGQYDKAMAEYDVAAQLNPGLAAVHLNRGVILANHKQLPEKALESYRLYISNGGTNDVVSELIKEAEQKIAAREEEKRTLEEAKKLEDEAKRQAAELEAAEKAKKDEELKKQIEAAKGKIPQPKPADAREKPKTAPATGPAPKKAPVPAKGDEPGDEPEL